MLLSIVLNCVSKSLLLSLFTNNVGCWLFKLDELNWFLFAYFFKILSILSDWFWLEFNVPFESKGLLLFDAVVVAAVVVLDVDEKGFKEANGSLLKLLLKLFLNGNIFWNELFLLLPSLPVKENLTPPLEFDENI